MLEEVRENPKTGFSKRQAVFSLILSIFTVIFAKLQDISITKLLSANF